jgi:hypothetical protein
MNKNQKLSILALALVLGFSPVFAQNISSSAHVTANQAAAPGSGDQCPGGPGGGPGGPGGPGGGFGGPGGNPGGPGDPPPSN